MKLSLSSRIVEAMTLRRLKRSSTSSPVISEKASPPASKSARSYLRRLRPKRATILSSVKMTVTVVGQVGSAAPVPFIQPIAEGVKKIVEHCEVRGLSQSA